MKRFLLTGLLLAAIGGVANAQTDDIYATGADQRGSQSALDSSHNNANNNRRFNNAQDNNDPDNYQSFNNADDYVDYEDNSYSSRINRFDNDFYNMGYYAAVIKANYIILLLHIC